MSKGTTIFAKFPGTCRACADTIEAGEQAEFYGKGEIYHYDCRPMADRKPDWRTFQQDGFVFTDLETSGLNPDEGTDENGNPGPCAIVQWSAISVSNRFVVRETFNSLVRPVKGLLYQPSAMAIHGLTLDDLAGAPEEYDVLEEYLEFCHRQGDNVRFAGYNWGFDWKFIRACMNRNGVVDTTFCKLPALCMYEVSKELYGAETKKKYGGVKQIHVCDHLGIKRGRDHNSLVDLFQAIQIARKSVSYD